MGFGLQSMVIGIFYCVVWGIWWARHPGIDELASPVMLGIGGCLIFVEVIIAVIFYHRYRRLPTKDRDTLGFIGQTRVYFKRGLLVLRCAK
jgi:hypothetical protein